MIAVDTNVLARWTLRDDDVQYTIAERILSEPCWLSWTVLLELGWLLGSYAGLPRAGVAAVLETLIALPTVYYDRPSNLRWAIERYAAGGDLADMFHIASSGDVTAFVSFETKLARKAGPDAPVPVERAL